MKLRFLTLFILLFAIACSGQTRTNRIFRPCPNSTTPASVSIPAGGDITLHPCSGKTVSIDSSRIPTVSGGTTNYFPYFTSAAALGTSPFSFTPSTRAFYFTNAQHDSEWTMTFTPNDTGTASGGNFLVGNTAEQTAYISTNNDGNVTLLAQNDLQIRGGSNGISIDSVSPIEIGDSLTGQSGTRLRITDNSQSFEFLGPATTFSVESKIWELHSSITSGGTVGNRTINTPVGTVNFTAGTSSLTLTNSAILSSGSIVFCVVRTNDATAKNCSVTDIAGGSAIVRLNANATAETSVGFWVTN